MTIVRGMDKARSLIVRGRLGTKKGEPRDGTNWAAISADRPHAGIYQFKYTKKGKEISKMKFYYPTNPRTPKQQNWRRIHAAGVTAWQALTQEQKNWYNKRVIKHYHFAGFNLFMRNWLNAHK